MTHFDPYPEHEKLKKIADRSQTCGEFIEWLQQHDYHLCEGSRVGREGSQSYWPTHQPIQKLLAAFFDIDLVAIEDEKRAMLDAMRAVNP